MKAFMQHTGTVIPLNRTNVDTDAIIPKQYLKSIKRTGFGPNLFDGWRYLDPGEPGMDNARRRLNPEFVLNDPRYVGGTVLLARKNFGCGSSREHAVWALDDYGIRVVIAPSFADIFYNNSFKSGLLPIVLDEAVVDELFVAVKAVPTYVLAINLEAQSVTTPIGVSYAFNIDSFRKHCLLEGLDDISLTLQHTDEIRAYEQRRRQEAPWLFPTVE